MLLNKLEVQICGMSRSGNHAVTNWVWAQTRGRKLLLNCAEGKTNPFLSCRPMDIDRDCGWKAHPHIDMEEERAGRHCRKDLLIHTYEDSWLRHAFSDDLQRRHDSWLGRSECVIRIVVLRDPFNLFASRRKIGAALPRNTARKMWKQHARQSLEDAAAARVACEPLVVLYNKWRTDSAYRRKIASAIGIAFTDAGFDSVPTCMGGSSFDGTAFDGRASQMATLERWRAYADEPEFRRIFDAEMKEMSAALFGEPPFS